MRTGAWNSMVLSVITASGRPKRSLRSKCTCSGSACSVRPGAQWWGRNQTETMDGGAIGPPVSAVGDLVVPEQRVAVLHRRARRPDVAALDRELPHLVVLLLADQVERAGQDRRRPPSCHHPPGDPAGHRLAVDAGLLQEVLGVGLRQVGQRHRPLRPRPSRPAAAPAGAARLPSDGRPPRPPAGPTNWGCPATSPTSSTGATQVSAPASASTHSSRVRVAKAAANAARMAGCAVVLELVAGELGAAQRARTGWRRTWPRSRPRPPTCRRLRAVGAVAGVAAREDVVARAGSRHRAPAARRPAATSATARPRPPTRRGRRPGPIAARPASAAVMASAACMPPAAASATVAPGSGGAAVDPRRAHGQVAADGEVVDVVARPLRRRAVLAVAAGRAVDDPGIARRHGGVADAQPVDDAGPEALDDDVGRRRQRQERRPTRRRP